MTNLQQRLITGSLLTALIAGAIYLSAYPFFGMIFALIIAASGGIATWEYYQISSKKGFHPLAISGVTLTVIYTMAIFASTQDPIYRYLPAALIALFGFFAFLHYFGKGDNPIANLAITAFGISYIAIPLATIVSIAFFFPSGADQDGRWWVFYLIAVTKMTDTGAFFIGKRFGKNLLAPVLSPKKTIEGAIGGLIASIATSVAMALLVPSHFDLTLWQSIYLGVAIAILAQVGDLAESVIKRDGGVKHSSQLPGLGGFLDIVDSALFTAPVVFFFLIWKTL